MNLDDEIEFEEQDVSIEQIKDFVDNELPHILEAFKNNIALTKKQEKDKVTKWMVPGNQDHYDIIGELTKRGKIDWRQTINAKVGDIVYIYISAPIKEIRYKCRVNKADRVTICLRSHENSLPFDQISFWLVGTEQLYWIPNGSA